MALEDSSTNAVLEQEAGVTSEDSLTSTETPNASQDGEKTTGETLPEGEKSSQSKPPSTDDEPDPPKGRDVPYGQYKRIKEDRDTLRSTRDQLAELGIKSKEDAEILLKDAEIAEVEAETRGRTNLVRWMIEDPIAFEADFHQNHPKQHQVIAEQAAARAMYARSQELSESNPELAAELLELAKVYHGNGNGNGHRAPKAPDPVTRELLAVRGEKQQVFENQATAHNTAVVRSQIDELSKGIAFNSEKQKARFHKDVIEGIQDALERNPTFTRQLDRLRDVRNLNQAQIQQRWVEVVELHRKHAADPTLLKRLIAAEREELGLRLTEPPPNGKLRTEANGSSAPPTGTLTQDDKDRIFSDLEKQGYSGTRLTEKYANALSKARLGA